MHTTSSLFVGVTQRRMVVNNVSGQPEEFLVDTELSSKVNPSGGTWYLWELNLEVHDEQCSGTCHGQMVFMKCLLLVQSVWKL